MRRNMPTVRRMWIQPGAVVVNVTNAQTASIIIERIIQRSMRSFVDLVCDDR
jgi:hypothetical protein